LKLSAIANEIISIKNENRKNKIENKIEKRKSLKNRETKNVNQKRRTLGKKIIHKQRSFFTNRSN